MECYLCTGPICPGQRTTFLYLTNRDGSPAAEWVMHEVCKDEMLRLNPDLQIPGIDLDAVG